MEVTCQCKAVHFSTSLAKPIELYHCHCSICRKQSASAFGTSAIFPTCELPTDTQPIAVWSRPAGGGEVCDTYFCTVCGTRLVHRVRREEQEVGEAASGRMCVKGGCIDSLDWSTAFHIYCDDAVMNLEFPEDVVCYKQDDDGERWTEKRVKRR